jgi:hypothetical protein
MKAWFNIANPGWLESNLAQPMRIGIKLQEKPYF